jgi:predicted nucleic acid-binding protein
MSLVIDASVFVAAALVEDKFHQTSADFLLEARVKGAVIYEPNLILAEVAGVVSRVRKDHA